MKYLIVLFLYFFSLSVSAAPDWAETAYKCDKRSIKRGYRLGFGEFECLKGFRNIQDKFCILKNGWCVKFK
jgi:hypothetical protein